MEYIYAALLLHKLGKTVDEHHLEKVVSATGAEADKSKVKILVASLKDVLIDEELEKASIAPVASAGHTHKETAKEDKKEEKKEEASAAAEGLSSLFG